MSSIRSRPGRNEPCPCGSTLKYKKCHGRVDAATDNDIFVPELAQYVDSGEKPVRWVISNDSGTAFFADKDARILVFATKHAALEIAQLDLFQPQDLNEINVAGVGPTKWQHLQATLPYVEITSAGEALALIHERIAAKSAPADVPDLSQTPPQI
jgi:hypothetical protein